MGCHPLLQENFPTQGLNPCLLHWQAGSLRLSHQGSPFPTSRVTYASHVCGKSLHVSVVRWGSMLSLIKGWGDLSRLSQPRDVKYSNNGFMNILVLRRQNITLSLTNGITVPKQKWNRGLGGDIEWLPLLISVFKEIYSQDVRECYPSTLKRKKNIMALSKRRDRKHDQRRKLMVRFSKENLFIIQYFLNHMNKKRQQIKVFV